MQCNASTKMLGPLHISSLSLPLSLLFDFAVETNQYDFFAIFGLWCFQSFTTTFSFLLLVPYNFFLLIVFIFWFSILFKHLNISEIEPVIFSFSYLSSYAYLGILIRYSFLIITQFVHYLIYFSILKKKLQISWSNYFNTLGCQKILNTIGRKIYNKLTM